MASGSVTPALCGLPAFSLRSVPVLSRSLSRWRQRPCRARTADPGTGAAGVRASRDRNTHWSALGPHGSGNPGTLAGASGHEGYAELAGQRASPRRPAPLEELIGGFESHLSTSPGVWPLELPCERSVDLEVAQHGHATVTSTYAVPGVAGDQAGRSAVHAPGSCQGCTGHRGRASSSGPGWEPMGAKSGVKRLPILLTITTGLARASVLGLNATLESQTNWLQRWSKQKVQREEGAINGNGGRHVRRCTIRQRGYT
jgi:hypothetical protein